MYQLNWSTLDQVRRRTAWLRATGFAELRFDNVVELTPAGEQLLRCLKLADPIQMDDQVAEVHLGEPAEWVRTAMVEAATNPASRRIVMGYIPGPTEDAIETLRALVSVASPKVSRSDFDQYCSSQLNIKPGSAASALTTLRSAGLVEQVGAHAFAPTPQALAWLSSGDDLDFVRWLQTRYRFFLEIIPALEAAPRPRQLAALAQRSFSFPGESVEEMRRRLQILRCSGLVVETAIGQYKATALGLAVAGTVPMQATGRREAAAASSSAPSPTREDTEQLLTRLRAAARDSSHPEEFEKLIARAFDLLGFTAQWMGGSGRTDVLVSTVYSDGLTIIIDAKSTASGPVGEGQINFDTLKEHMVQHGAQCVAVVGPGFAGERLIKRAEQHGVLLIGIDRFEQLVRGHLATPLSPADYGSFLRQSGLASMEELEAKWAAQLRVAQLVRAVFYRLNHEAQIADPVTHGALSSSDLYLVLRSEMATPPTPDELQHVLDFLAAEPMRCIVEAKGRYSLAEDPATTACRLRAYADAAEAGASIA
jgi:hypothetical protein